MACVCGDDASRCCASCRRVFDVALILPCSHTLCARCLAEGAGSGRGGGVVMGVAPASRLICAVLCPNCRHSVELPCFDWSSALTCLPFDPTVTPDPKASEETGECPAYYFRLFPVWKQSLEFTAEKQPLKHRFPQTFHFAVSVL